MKFHARLAVVLTIARFVEPQVVPPCAKTLTISQRSCLSNTDFFTSDSTVCDFTDITCQCTDEEYLSNALCCLYEQCSDSNRKEAEEISRRYCSYAGLSIPSGIVCSTVASTSADIQSTETSEPEQSSVMADESLTTAESTTVDGSSATVGNSGSETAANSAFEPSGLPTSERSGGSTSSPSGTTNHTHALTLKLSLGLGIGLGVPLVGAVIYLALLQRKKLKGQRTLNNQQAQLSSYRAPPPQGYPPPGYPASSYLPQGYPGLSAPPQVQSQQGQLDPHK
ncbi:hypothetical protein B0T10DRAFT_553960, partial [Thelonectria olida]